MEKRGFSYIELIISFLLFFALIVFLLFFFNPVKKPDISEALLDSIEEGMKDYTLTITQIPFALADTSAGKGKAIAKGCLKIKCPFEKCEKESGAIFSSKVFVKDEYNFLPFDISDSNLIIKPSGRFYNTYYSDEIVNSERLDNDKCNAENFDYTFSVPRVYTIYSFKKLDDLKARYSDETGYAELKQQFDFPLTLDFAILVTSSEKVGTETEVTNYFNMTRKKPAAVVVKARELPIILFKEKNEIKAMLAIQVW